MLIVGESNQTHICCLESFFCYREAVCVACYHADNLKSCLAKSIDSLEGRTACGDEIFHHYHLGTFRESAFYLIAHAVILWLWTHIAVRHTKLISDECTLGDGSCSNAGYSLSLWKLSVDKVNQLLLYERAKLWVSQCLAIICINR